MPASQVNSLAAKARQTHMANTDSITVTPLNAAFGAEVSEIDLSRTGNGQQLSEIEEALLAHKLLIFRDQSLTPESLVRLGRHFGSLDIHPHIKALPGYPEVLPIIKEPEERGNFGGGWHSEVSFYEKPAMGTMLYALEVPPSGRGDTLMADGAAAWNALSPTMQEMLDGLTAIHSAERVYGPGGAYQPRADNKDSGTGVIMSEAANRRVEHPLVRRHPVTGEKSLYVNSAFTLSIKSMRQDEASALLKFLCDHATKAEFCARLHWETGTLAFWDNRTTQHYALNDYPGERRVMHRVVIEGDKPI